MHFPIIPDARQWWIYLLVDPRVTSGRSQDEVQYVGFSVDVPSRSDMHVNSVSKLPVSQWIQHLKLLGLLPGIRAVDTGFGESWKLTERFWIRFYREDVGACLLNCTNGGDDVLGARWSWSNKARESYSRKCLGRVQSEQSKVRTSLSLSGVPHSEDHNRRVGDALRGQKRAPKMDDQKRRLSESLRGRPKPPGFGEKISKLLIGKQKPPHIGWAVAESNKLRRRSS